MPSPDSSTRIPVVILAGFLGAGKTTFLRKILPLLADGPHPPYVILNDFLNAEVDSASLREFTNEISAIAAGCVCCDASDGLVDALDAVPAEIRPIVLIEANGTTDPYPLVEIIATDPLLADRFGPLRQVAIINEVRWQKRLFPWDRKLERAQLQAASHIHTNRGLKAPVKQQHRVRNDISALNRRSRITSPEKLAAEIIAELGDDTTAHSTPDIGAGTPAGHAHHHVAARISMPPITEDQLRRWLTALPPEIPRVKGVAILPENAGIRHFQRTDYPDEPPHLMHGVLPDGIEPCAILIGPSVNAAAAESLLHSIIGPQVATPPRV